MLQIKLLLFSLFLNYIHCFEFSNNVKLDYYYEVDLKEYNGTLSINVKDIYNQTIIKVSKNMYDELLFTGTGILPNKTIINMYKKNKFEYVNPKYKYTIGSKDNELIPNRSISTNMFNFGTYVYIENYKEVGLEIITKDGCFRVDDNNNDNNKITIFTGIDQILNKDENKNINIYTNICSF